jgi:thiamine transporter
MEIFYFLGGKEMKLKKETLRMLMTINLLVIAIVIDLVVSAIPGLNLSMPFGGKFFGLSMFPLVLIGLLFGIKYGLIAGLIYAIYNFGFDYLIYIDALRITLESWTGESWNAMKIISLIMLDYIIPFMAFGLSGLFHDGLKSKQKLIYATLFVSVIRLISSTLSGVILWSSSIEYASSLVESGEGTPNIATRLFAFVGESLWVYSLGYNLIYILTTTIVVLVIALLTHRRIQTIFEPITSQSIQ